MFDQKRLDGAPEVSDALAVNQADLEDAFLLARGEIINHEVIHFAWLKTVEIENAIDGDLDRAGIPVAVLCIARLVHAQLWNGTISQASSRIGVRPSRAQQAANAKRLAFFTRPLEFRTFLRPRRAYSAAWCGSTAPETGVLRGLVWVE
jgi:hypothetical protein